MATSTVIPDDIKTLKSDVSKLKNDQGSYATKLYVDSKDEIVGDWSASC
ncbi:tail fiber domain-containing protein, partial [Escherichia coli]